MPRPTPVRKTLLWLMSAVVLAGLFAAGLRAYGIALVGSGYTAEISCVRFRSSASSARRDVAPR